MILLDAQFSTPFSLLFLLPIRKRLLAAALARCRAGVCPHLPRAPPRSLDKYGPTHTDTLNAVNNLAVFLKSIGRFEKALPLYERVLKGDEAALGPDHPHTVGTLRDYV